ncbi:MAG: gliding motility-associated C-terminal domain-containing protein [Flavobacteriales bacterium]|nr:gliding motility-associated C-terminal domain-containing protein [Flavobacteriales bacterium]
MTRPQILLVLTKLMLAATSVVGQDHWARRVGSWSNDAFSDVAVDLDGNLFVAGEFGGNINLAGATLISNGSLDAMVAKYSADGSLLWAHSFGGPGLDRAIKLEITADGGIAVVGQYMGAVNFGASSLISQAGTQDCFVLKMGQADGEVLWARSGGGANGVDQPNGVSVGPDGSIAVAGEFRGTAIFDQGSLTSTTDPDTGLPSVDIFLATYTGDGTPLWIVHGAAEFADRGMDVEHDAEGNLYLTGQFTDTLTLAGNVHENAMFSAVFLARFTPSGTEDWFRVFGGGTYNQVFEMLLVADSYLMLVGDVQGTVIFLDSQPDLFTPVEARSSYLLKVGLDGELIAHKTWGSEFALNTRALSVQDEDVAVFGRFTCQLTGFISQYGASSFLSSGVWDLYIARFQTSDLDFKQAQQFAGIGEKVPGGIVHASDGEPVFAGSFEHVLSLPSDGLFSIWPIAGGESAEAPPGYCTDANYPNYSFLRGSALKDGFIARGYLDGREPHDPYERSGTDCDRSFRLPVIRRGEQGELGPDSIHACVQATLRAHTFTAFDPDTSVRHNAPDYRFLWSTGATAHEIVTAISGWYWVDVSIGLQCYTWRDSVHISVEPNPPKPLISDDVVVNTEAIDALPIEVCEPQQPWLWATGLEPGNTVQWILQGGVLSNSDSAQAVASGLYVVIATSPNGCQRFASVSVVINPVGPLPPFDIELTSNYPQDVDQNDTISMCPGVSLLLQVEAQLTLNGQPSGLTYGVKPFYRCTQNGAWTPTVNDLLGFTCNYAVQGEGWYVNRFGFMLTNAPCGEDTLFVTGIDSVYVIPYESTEPVIDVSPGALICPGDTLAITGSCANCTTTGWTGLGIVALSGDTAWVVMAGDYYFTGSTISPQGCVGFGQTSVAVSWNPLPPLFVDPLDGIICPNDSAMVWTDAPGSDWQWFGPLGPLSQYNDSIYSSQQGFYYLEMTDTLGCRVTSNPILITDYATPFLNVIPDNVICEPGETSTLQVVTTSESTLQWWAPFAGSTATEQTVTQPGIYTCEVNACGITTVLSVEIYGNTASADLVVPGPFTLCPGDEVALMAIGGNAIYYWEPGLIFSQSITVDTAGTFLLVVADPNGCRDSLYTTVEVLPEFDALALVDTAFCAGDPMIAVVSGIPQITWYADAAQTQVIGTGNTLDLGTAQQGMTVWVEQIVGQCGSGSIQVDLIVSEPPDAPVINGPFSGCTGDSVSIAPVNPGAMLYSWTTPTGSVAGNPLVIDPVTFAADGEYTVWAVNPGCAPTSASFVFTVNAAGALSIGNDTLICPSGSATFNVPAGFASPSWSDGSSQSTFMTGSAGEVILIASDATGCFTSDTALVAVFTFTDPLSVTGATICLGQDAMLLANGSGTFTWYADAGLSQSVHTGAQWFFDQPQDSAFFHVVQTEGACSSEALPIALNVTPTPNDAQVNATSPVCMGAPFELWLTGTGDPTGAWATPEGTLITGAVLSIGSADAADGGEYLVVPSIGGCAGSLLSVTIVVVSPQHPVLADTVLCEGGSLAMALPDGYSNAVWSTGASGNSIIITSGGTYTVTAADPNGCLVSAVSQVTVEGCDPDLPNVITPNGDGWNDGFRLPPGGYVSAQLRVWNRWGQLVWEGDATSGAFRGEHRNGEPLSEGTYYFELLLTLANGAVKPRTGHLTLQR